MSFTFNPYAALVRQAGLTDKGIGASEVNYPVNTQLVFSEAGVPLYFTMSLK